MSSLLVTRKKGNSCYAGSPWEPANDDVRCWGCYSAMACLPWASPHQMLALFFLSKERIDPVVRSLGEPQSWDR